MAIITKVNIEYIKDGFSATFQSPVTMANTRIMKDSTEQNSPF